MLAPGSLVELQRDSVRLGTSAYFGHVQMEDVLERLAGKVEGWVHVCVQGRGERVLPTPNPTTKSKTRGERGTSATIGHVQMDDAVAAGRECGWGVRVGVGAALLPPRSS